MHKKRFEEKEAGRLVMLRRVGWWEKYRGTAERVHAGLEGMNQGGTIKEREKMSWDLNPEFQSNILILSHWV